MPSLKPTASQCWCNLWYGTEELTYDDNISTLCRLDSTQTCLFDWFWGPNVKITKFHIYTTDWDWQGGQNYCHGIWLYINESWVRVSSDIILFQDMWNEIDFQDTYNVKGIRLGLTVGSLQTHPAIHEVWVEYEDVTCEDITNQTECESAGCYWWGDACHSEPFNACEQITTPTICEAAGCYWYNGACYSDPPVCGILMNQSDCLYYGCYWYNGSCHTNLYCDTINNQTDCEANGCYWYDGACHSDPQTPCEDYLTQATCEAAGCYWYDGSCHSNPATGTTVGEFVWEQTQFRTGPYQPGAICKPIRALVKNVGDKTGVVKFRLVEYPGDANQSTLYYMGLEVEPGASMWYEPEVTAPTGITTWPLGAKVWGISEDEPPW